MQAASDFHVWHDIAAAGAMSGVRPAETARSGSTPQCVLRDFDIARDRDWLELIRDVAAIANSGGGELALRLSENQRTPEPHGRSVADLLRSQILERLSEYSGSKFDDVIVRSTDDSSPFVVLTVGRTLFPIVFGKAGCISSIDDGTIKREVFSAGSIYFRHDNQTAPGTTDDVRSLFERLLRRIRRRWLAGIRRVMSKPIDSDAGIKVATKRTPGAVAEAPQPVRITTDPDAPALQPQDVSRLYPWRQKDLLEELNRRIGRRALTTYDIQAVRRQHALDERPDYVFYLPGAGRRYSPAAADWFVDEHQRDPDFFQKARAADQEMLKLNRRKPR